VSWQGAHGAPYGILVTPKFAGILIRTGIFVLRMAHPTDGYVIPAKAAIQGTSPLPGFRLSAMLRPE